MTEADRLLAELWAADEPPEQDPGFVLAVVERAERRRLWRDLAGVLSGSVAAGAVLWALAPVVEPIVRDVVPPASDPGLAIVAAADVVAAWLWAWTSGRPGLPAL